MIVKRVILVVVATGEIQKNSIQKKSENLMFLTHFSINWFREWRLWPHYLNYFPMDLIKSVDLPADRNYLLCLFPHGVIW